MTIEKIKEILASIKSELEKVESVNIAEAVNSIKHIDSMGVMATLSGAVEDIGTDSYEVADLDNAFFSAKRKLENSLYAYEEKIIERKSELRLAIDDIESFLHDGEFAYASEVAKNFE
ncbi:MAG: hypothetical protein CME70_05980 [Halobacteriovorax sp.]|nr:hypothetical protein [Halobacteriovorax sp.]|tara:strand:- start:557 stop:910 length:354 start_codon:yes stop_codon:yes gene_type:complete